MFAWRDQVTSPAGQVVDRYFTDAAGGVSTGSYAGLNLGAHVGDDAELVERNRQLLADAVGVTRERLVFMNQVHGRDVEVIDAPRAGDAPAYDGVVTATPDLALVVLVADCTPVLLTDVEAGVIGAVHAGRPGMTARIVDTAISQMRDLGAQQISAAVGPSVCGRCYEVPSAMREDAAAVSASSSAVTWIGTPAIDVAAGVVEQLKGHEVDVTWAPGCTRESSSLYSYRRDPKTGRFAGVVVLRGRENR